MNALIKGQRVIRVDPEQPGRHMTSCDSFIFSECHVDDARKNIVQPIATASVFSTRDWWIAIRLDCAAEEIGFQAKAHVGLAKKSRALRSKEINEGLSIVGCGALNNDDR